MKALYLIFIILCFSCREINPISICIKSIENSEEKNIFKIELEFRNHTNLDLCIADFWWPYPPYVTAYLYSYDHNEKNRDYSLPAHPLLIPDSLRMIEDTGLLDAVKMRRMLFSNPIVLARNESIIVHGKIVRGDRNKDYFKKGKKVRIEYVPNNIDYTRYPEFIYLIRNKNLHFLNFSDTIFSNFEEFP